MPGALDGIKILDITNYIAGPFATMLLADLGAEVYKIETPGAGDPFRTWDKEPKDYSPSFCGMNRNKKSLTLHMKTPEGREVFFRLPQDADVIVENLRPGRGRSFGNRLRRY
jgi:crotonobetainyl-CoA:carnitine CoA-transferase CaiB-like acyl-CoA transferase